MPGNPSRGAEHQPPLLTELCGESGVFGVRVDSGRLAAGCRRTSGSVTNDRSASAATPLA
jgi:hypothetical protein